jgi:hypothetical protein
MSHWGFDASCKSPGNKCFQNLALLVSNDCGFATSAAGDEVHPDVAWAKLEAFRTWGTVAM